MSKVLAVLLAITMTIATRGMTVMFLWSWFVVDQLGAPRLGWLDACGLVLIVRTTTWTVDGDRDEEQPPETPRSILRGAAASCIVLLTGLAIGALVALAVR